ncbi:MAG: NTP transferase domain-containing protein [Acidimicrobiales bacterium]
MLGRRCTALILAASPGDRMRSSSPQALHELCGRPMLQYAIESLESVQPERIVVVLGDGADRVAKALSGRATDLRLMIAEQHTGRGSAHAALVGLDSLAESAAGDVCVGGGVNDYDDDPDVIVLPGNLPLLHPELVAELVAAHRAEGAAATVLASPPGAGAGFGHLVPGNDPALVQRVVPATTSLADPWLSHLGVTVVRMSLLAPALRRVRPDPVTGEFDFDGMVEVLDNAGHQVRVFQTDDRDAAQPVDDRVQLAAVEATLRRRINRHWMSQGVTMVDPERTYVDATVTLSADVTVLPGSVLQASTVIGPRAEIGPDTHLVDCAVGSDAIVSKTVGRDAEVGEAARVGPFAVLEPGSHVAPATVTGPFHHGVATD